MESQKKTGRQRLKKLEGEAGASPSIEIVPEDVLGAKTLEEISEDVFSTFRAEQDTARNAEALESFGQGEFPVQDDDLYLGKAKSPTRSRSEQFKPIQPGSPAPSKSYGRIILPVLLAIFTFLLLAVLVGISHY